MCDRYDKEEQLFSKKYDEYIKLLKSTLSKKRFIHSVNVASMCLSLAKKHGADAEKAYLAGLLHDIKKEEMPDAMKAQAILSKMDVSDEELYTQALWHGPAAAYHISRNLGINDAEILNAVRYHTAGRAEMTDIEKIVYLGDLTSADRSYKDVEKYREMSFENLDNAMFFALKYSIGETLEKGGVIPPCTIAGYNYYAKLYRAKKAEKERKISKND